jgi:hypothetical protein
MAARAEVLSRSSPRISPSVDPGVWRARMPSALSDLALTYFHDPAFPTGRQDR